MIFLDIEFSQIETSEIDCIGAISISATTGARVEFLQRLAPILAKKAFIRFAFSSSRTARVLSSRLNGPILGLLFGFVASDNTFQYAAVDFAASMFSKQQQNTKNMHQNELQEAGELSTNLIGETPISKRECT